MKIIFICVCILVTLQTIISFAQCKKDKNQGADMICTLFMQIIKELSRLCVNEPFCDDIKITYHKMANHCYLATMNANQLLLRVIFCLFMPQLKCLEILQDTLHVLGITKIKH